MSNSQLGINTILNRIIYFVIGLFLLLFSLGAIAIIPVMILQGTNTLLEKVGTTLIIGVPAVFLLIVAIICFKRANSYSEEKEKEKQRRKAEQELKKIEENKIQDNKRRENNPHLLSELNISAIGLLVVGLGLLIFLALFLITKDQSYLWGVGIFGIPTLLYSIVSELEGKRLTENEMTLVNLVLILFRSIKWISLIGIAFLVLSMFVGWISSVPATTIIIILLILILLK